MSRSYGGRLPLPDALLSRSPPLINIGSFGVRNLVEDAPTQRQNIFVHLSNTPLFGSLLKFPVPLTTQEQIATMALPKRVMKEMEPMMNNAFVVLPPPTD